MIKPKLQLISILICTMLLLLSCHKKLTGTAHSIRQTNTAAAQNKPYLILISLDGFRWDYLEKYQPPHLSAFLKNGVRASSLIPVFPTKTFTNHYTIATGLYPDKHGILSNTFYHHQKDTIFNKRTPGMAQDGSFYGGSPIWVEANNAGMVTASYFFVGSEANIKGITPTYYHKYDKNVTNQARVTQTINWLKLNQQSRPHLITLYFGDLDKVGHTYGTLNEDKLKHALFELDNSLGQLFKGVAQTGLPVNIIIVSDHGMANQSTQNIIPIEHIENKDLFMAIENGTMVNIYPNKGVSTDSVFRYLKQKEKHFKVYKTENTPGFEYTPKNKNWGAIQVLPDYGYYFWNQKRKARLIETGVTNIGIHGYDSKHKEMHGIFYASGPAFKADYQVPSFKNIHIYPLMCKLLDIDIPKHIDGDLTQIESVLKD